VIVVDASAVLEVLLQTPAAAAIHARLFQPPQRLSAPHLIDLEVAQILRKASLSGIVTGAACQMAFDNWRLFPVTRYPHDLFLPRIWALQQYLSAYDASYIAVAEMLNAPLVTHDGRLANAPGHKAKIELM